MKYEITIQTAEFKKALPLLKFAKSGSKIVSVCRTVRVRSANGISEIMATDLHISMQFVAKNGSGLGDVCLDADALLPIVKECQRPWVTVAYEIHDNAERAARVNGIPVPAMSPESFPELPDVPTLHKAPADLGNEIEATYHAISDDESRYFMNGFYIDTENGRLVSTDGRRLYRSREMDLKDFGPSAIVPRLPGQWDFTHYGQGNGVNGNAAYFLTESGILISAQTIQAQFPNYARVIPEPQAYYLSNYTAENMEAAAKALVKLAGGLPKLEKARRMFLTPEAAYIEAKPERLLAVPLNAPADPTIALNVEYILDACAEVTDKKIRLAVSRTSPDKKAVFFQEAGGRILVIMPMQIDDLDPADLRKRSGFIPEAQAPEAAPDPEPTPEPKAPEPTPAPQAIGAVLVGTIPKDRAKPRKHAQKRPENRPEPENVTKDQPEAEKETAPQPVQSQAQNEPAAQPQTVEPGSDEHKALVKAAFLAVLTAGGTLEEIGSWFWAQIPFAATEARAALKAAGFTWSKARKSWYLSPNGRQRRKAGSVDPHQIHTVRRIDSADEVSA